MANEISFETQDAMTTRVYFHLQWWNGLRWTWLFKTARKRGEQDRGVYICLAGSNHNYVTCSPGNERCLIVE
jgi:hypothetical protein